MSFEKKMNVVQTKPNKNETDRHCFDPNMYTVTVENGMYRLKKKKLEKVKKSIENEDDKENKTSKDKNKRKRKYTKKPKKENQSKDETDIKKWKQWPKLLKKSTMIRPSTTYYEEHQPINPESVQFEYAPCLIGSFEMLLNSHREESLANMGDDSIQEAGYNVLAFAPQQNLQNPTLMTLSIKSLTDSFHLPLLDLF